MLSDTKKSILLPWVPMGFCAFLSMITIVAQVWMMAAYGPASSGTLSIVFLCNIPMCFFFVGILTSKLQREVRDLKAQLVVLQEHRTERA